MVKTYHLLRIELLSSSDRMHNTTYNILQGIFLRMNEHLQP